MLNLTLTEPQPHPIQPFYGKNAVSPPPLSLTLSSDLTLTLTFTLTFIYPTHTENQEEGGEEVGEDDSSKPLKKRRMASYNSQTQLKQMGAIHNDAAGRLLYT